MTKKVVGLTGLVILVLIAACLFLWKSSKERVSLSQRNVERGASIQAGQQSKEKFACRFSDKDYCNYLQIIATRNPYFVKWGPATAILVDGNGNKTVTVVRSDGVNQDIIISVNNKEIQRLILLDGKIYKKDVTTGNWQTLEATDARVKMLNTLDANNVINLKSLLESTIQPTKIGSTACGALKCFEYYFGDVNGKQEVRFDSQNYLLRKFKMTNKDGSTLEVAPDYTTSKILAPSV
ncbi:MAG: hypothetical protein Q7S57_04355 [bacterium]|nr:hypothetical protein [bacterium]